ncbi:hypothetical protein [Psychromonas sp.]|uniref:hypothetical protein n=1 Tax=Psychromonas sp. TaxID=1884585 RepID=UPI003A976182
MKIYLHIGAGKCGSSSIQNYFTYNNQFHPKKAYCAITSSGDVITGNTLESLARKNVYDYSSSVSFVAIKEDLVKKKALKDSLANLSLQYDEIVLSNEGWLDEFEIFESFSDVFNAYEVEVLFIVRPPVQWLNSGWWQWGEWSDVNLETWINANISKVLWFDFYSKWDAADIVSKVHTVVLERDVLIELSEIIQFDYKPLGKNTNVSSDYQLLRLFKERRALRPSPHDPRVEFSLNRHIVSKGKPDWVLSQVDISKILRKTEESNQRLLNVVYNPSAINNDMRWWGKGYYKDIDLSLNINAKLDTEELYDMLEDAYKVIHKLDMELRKCSKS